MSSLTLNLTWLLFFGCVLLFCLYGDLKLPQLQVQYSRQSVEERGLSLLEQHQMEQKNGSKKRKVDDEKSHPTGFTFDREDMQVQNVFGRP